MICVSLNTKFHNTSQKFYFEVTSCEVINVTDRYMDFILDLDEEFDFFKDLGSVRERGRKGVVSYFCRRFCVT